MRLANRARAVIFIYRRWPQIFQKLPATLATKETDLLPSWEGKYTYNNFGEICKEISKNLGMLGHFLTDVKSLNISSLDAKIFAYFLARFKNNA